MMMQTKAYRLVLVDSRLMFRQGLRALLKRFQDLEIVGDAADGITALELARELQPDVVLIDIHVADADVLQTTAELRREFPHANVIILSANADDPNFVFQAIRAGARGCVSQDGEVEDLVKAIRLVGQGQAVLGPKSLTSLIDLITRVESPVEQARVADRLTVREREVLELVSQGSTNRVIAERLYVSESTVRSHIHNILEKLQLTNRVQAATFALTKRHADRSEPMWSLVQAPKEECRV